MIGETGQVVEIWRGSGRKIDDVLATARAVTSDRGSSVHSRSTAQLSKEQDGNRALLSRGQEALTSLILSLADAQKTGVSESDLTKARALQRKAQWRLDFVYAENSMGFHASQEAARILAEARPCP